MPFHRPCTHPRIGMLLASTAIQGGGSASMCLHDGLGTFQLGAFQTAAFQTKAFSRRGVLRATAASALALAVGPGFAGAARAAESHIKSTHGSGFCNLNYFLANALQTAQADGVDLDFVVTPSSAEMVTFL